MKLIYGFAIFFFCACSLNKQKPSSNCKRFYIFRHTEELVSLPDEDISYKISEREVNKNEIDTLKNILKMEGREYYVTIEGNLLICDYSDNNDEIILKDLVQLENELTRRKTSSKPPLH